MIQIILKYIAKDILDLWNSEAVDPTQTLWIQQTRSQKTFNLIHYTGKIMC